MDVCDEKDKATADSSAFEETGAKNSNPYYTVIFMYDMFVCLFIHGFVVDCEKDGQLQGTCPPWELLSSVWPVVVHKDTLETVLPQALQYRKEETTTHLQEN